MNFTSILAEVNSINSFCEGVKAAYSDLDGKAAASLITVCDKVSSLRDLIDGFAASYKLVPIEERSWPKFEVNLIDIEDRADDAKVASEESQQDACVKQEESQPELPVTMIPDEDEEEDDEDYVLPPIEQQHLIEDKDIPNRYTSRLKRTGIKTYEQLAQYTEEEVRKMPGVGETTILYFIYMMRVHGLKFRKKKK